jgi:hypothetical protein
MNADEHSELSIDVLPIEADQDSLEALPAQAIAGATLVLRASGLYRRKPTGRLPIAQRDELRLDVDGRFPQRMASGVMRSGLANRLHWVARLKSTGPAAWAGRIFYRDASAAMPQYTQVAITVSRPALGQPLRAQVAFAGGSATPLKQVYDFVSRSFDTVEFEFDSTADAHPALAIQTHDHPNRPPGMINEVLSIAKVYERVGFNVNITPPGPAIPLTGAGVDGRWSDTEMHDAMQAHWSRFANRPQLALWVFHAALHESGTSLGGIMFDDIGPNHRQGTAIFTESFIAQAPAGDAAPVAWVARMRFWTACHEMGHAFNLAHSWQKSLGTPWVPLADDAEARSFMNYPYNVSGGQTAFFADFGFRFSDPELQFMRHAPRRFVQMGDAAWFDHHAFEEACLSPEPKLSLTVRTNREQSRLQFLEPAMIELKATNVSKQPLLLPEDLLRDSHYLTLVVKRGEQPARQWHPYATTCHEPSLRVLAPGESMYAPVFVGAGQSGWLVAEPGRYRLQACLHLPDGEDAVSAPMELRIAPPAGYDEEFLAQDLFSSDVGRALAFDGTRELGSANHTLREAVAKLPQRAVGTHAMVALGMPLRRAGKVLRGDGDGVEVKAVKALPDEARLLLGDALLTRQDSSAATLGHVEFREYVETFAGWLASEGDAKAGKDAMSQACSTLEKRKVKPAVVAEMRAFGDALSSGGAAKKPRAKK